MGRGKRKLLKQNWMPISQAKADEALKDVGSQEEKEALSSKIKEFNTGLSSLAQKKLDYAKLRLENDEFKAKYKTILAIVDGKLNSSYKLPKNLVVALPPADEGGNPQYILIDSGSYRVRKHAANELAKIFLGRLIHTGPLLGDIASLKALLKVIGIFLASVTVQVFLVIGLNKDC